MPWMRGDLTRNDVERGHHLRVPGWSRHNNPCHATLEVLAGIALQILVERFLATIESSRLRVAVERADEIGQLLPLLGVTGECALQRRAGLGQCIQCAQECGELLL